MGSNVVDSTGCIGLQIDCPKALVHGQCGPMDAFTYDHLKLKSAAGRQDVNGPETPTKSSSAITGCFERICRLFNIDLPFGIVNSPSKQAHSLENEIIKKIQYLYFRVP